MKFRQQRGGLAESMKTVVEIAPTAEALAAVLKVPPASISVKPYGGIDKRIDWDTHLVCVKGNAVGFTDGPLK